MLSYFCFSCLDAPLFTGTGRIDRHGGPNIERNIFKGARWHHWWYNRDENVFHIIRRLSEITLHRKCTEHRFWKFDFEFSTSDDLSNRNWNLTMSGRPVSHIFRQYSFLYSTIKISYANFKLWPTFRFMWCQQTHRRTSAWHIISQLHISTYIPA